MRLRTSRGGPPCRSPCLGSGTSPLAALRSSAPLGLAGRRPWWSELGWPYTQLSASCNVSPPSSSSYDQSATTRRRAEGSLNAIPPPLHGGDASFFFFFFVGSSREAASRASPADAWGASPSRPQIWMMSCFPTLDMLAAGSVRHQHPPARSRPAHWRST